MDMDHVISIEELLSRKVSGVRTEAGETSIGCNQPVTLIEETQRASIEVHEEASACTGPKAELFKKLEVLRDNIMQNHDQQPKQKIQKVTLLLRNHINFEKYFEPRAVSLGPIHYGKKKYELAEKLKLELAYQFIEDSGKDDKYLYQKIEGQIKELRECFEEEVTKKYNDEALSSMLFLDGCAILRFIYCIVHPEFDKSKIKCDQVAFWQRDLFLLENQLPYRLLEDLMDGTNFLLVGKKDGLRELIKKFINMINREPGQNGKEGNKATYPSSQSSETKPPIHLLDLLRTSLLEPEEGNPNEVETIKSKCNHRDDDLLRTRLLEPEDENPNVAETVKSKCIRLLDLLKISPPRNRDPVEKNGEPTFRNVQELKAAGIKLEPSTNRCLKNISFTNKWIYPGHLRLPQITVDDATTPKFMNLIAYEMCPDFDNDFGITSYISFLDSLIDNRDDVMELRKSHILCNYLGSDKEVAKLFNEIGTDLVPNPDIYRKVKEDIQNYYDNKLMTWMAEAIHKHFSSPWAFLGLFAALLTLAIAITSIVYTIKSSS